MSLLKILSNMQTSRASGPNDEDLLSHLLRSLVGQSALDVDKNLSGLTPSANGPAGTKFSIGQKVYSNGHQIPPRPKLHNSSVLAATIPQRLSHSHDSMVENLHTSSQKPGIMIPSAVNSFDYGESRSSSIGKARLNKFDLNDIYIDSYDVVEDAEQFPLATYLGTGSPVYPIWMQQDSQTSRTSVSPSAQSPFSSNGEAQISSDLSSSLTNLFGYL